MKKFLLSTAILLLILAVVSGQVYAGKMVSINFAQGTNQVFAGHNPIGPLETNSRAWNNTNDFVTGGFAEGTMVGLFDSMGAPTGIDVAWASSGVGWNSDGTGDDEHKLSVGYLDDQNNFGKGVFITLTNIPYANYTIYGLFSSNAGDGIVNFDVNGTWVLGGDKDTTAAASTTINANMSANGEYWTLIEPGVTAGNYWQVDTTGATCIIEGELQNDTKRGRLCGLIIVTDEPYQRSISTNFTYNGFGDYYAWNDEVGYSTNYVAGYFTDPNEVIDPNEVQASGPTWNEGPWTQTSGIAGKVKDESARIGSAYLLNDNNFDWYPRWLQGVDGFFTGTDTELNGTPWQLEDAVNKLRVSQGFIGHWSNGTDPARRLSSIQRNPYSDYMVVVYMHPNVAVEQEIRIEDQTYYYMSQLGGDFQESLKILNGSKWLLATDTTGPASELANVAIFDGLSAPAMEIFFDTPVNSGISGYQIFSNVNADDVVTQVLPGNVDKDFGDTPVSINTELSWNAPVNGADSYEVYLGQYGSEDPNLYAIASTGTTATPTLDYGMSYVWRVDVVRDAETISGDYFYFDVEGDPILQLQPGSVSVEAGTDTFLTVDALLTDNYQWFYSVDDVIGDDTEVQSGPDATLDVTNVTEGVNTGYYYVVLTNNISGSNAVTSDLASLEIGQLELYLPFEGDPDSVDVFLDASGNGWDADYGNLMIDPNDPNLIIPSMGTVSFETGHLGVGQAVKFTRGTGDQLVIPGSDDYFNFYPKGFTIRFWVKPTYGMGGYLTYISKSSDDWNSPDRGWRMFDEAEYAGQGLVANMAPMSLATPLGRLDDGNWHMVACTYDGATREMKVYQEGFLQGTVTGSLSATTSYPVVIGNQYSTGTGGWGYEGLIDEIEVLSYAVSEYDMLDYYATKTGQEYCLGDIAGDINDDCKVNVEDLSDLATEWLDTTNPGTPPTTRVVNWQFDETSGMTVADSSGNGIVGILGVGFADDANAQWVIDGGRIGTIGDNALYINGDPNTWVIADSNSITMPFANGAGNIFEGTASWTMNIWIKYAATPAISVNIGGFGRNEWLDPSTNSDRYFASYGNYAGYEVELGQDGLFPSNTIGADWQMLTATYDGTTCIAYYNGQELERQEVALVDTLVNEINLNTARRVLWDAGAVSMNGHIDDFSIWSEAFGAAQVLGMYENSFPSCDGAIDGDLNGDCTVTLEDFAILAVDWLECNIVPSSLCD